MHGAGAQQPPRQRAATGQVADLRRMAEAKNSLSQLECIVRGLWHQHGFQACDRRRAGGAGRRARLHEGALELQFERRVLAQDDLVAALRLSQAVRYSVGLVAQHVDLRRGAADG